jgi:hypothetical protein
MKWLTAAKVWAKIGPRPETPHFCDLLIWAKTVAILGVPPAGCPQGGTSGACAPSIYLLDALLGRRRFETYYGQYVRDDASPMVPSSVHAFARCVANIGLMDYAAARASAACGSGLADAVRALLDAYAGAKGWLGRHASKAFNYLCISTITGRNASVSGHERYFSRQTWERAAQNLDAPRRERMPLPRPVGRRASPCPSTPDLPRAVFPVGVRVSIPPPQRRRAGSATSTLTHCKARRPAFRSGARGPPVQPSASAPQDVRTIPYSELSRHIARDDLWNAIDNTVYDVSEYDRRHPAGPAILGSRTQAATCQAPSGSRTCITPTACAACSRRSPSESYCPCPPL